MLSYANVEGEVGVWSKLIGVVIIVVARGLSLLLLRILLGLGIVLSMLPMFLPSRLLSPWRFDVFSKGVDSTFGRRLAVTIVWKNGRLAIMNNLKDLGASKYPDDGTVVVKFADITARGRAQLSLSDCSSLLRSTNEGAQGWSTANANRRYNRSKDAQGCHCENKVVPHRGRFAQELLCYLFPEQGKEWRKICGQVVGEVIPPICLRGRHQASHQEKAKVNDANLQHGCWQSKTWLAQGIELR
jgi:uncharacterized protein YceK